MTLQPESHSNNPLSRRQFLKWTTGSAAVAASAMTVPFGTAQSRLWAEESAPTAENKKPRVGVVFTEFTHRSHAHVLVENFLQPYLFNGQQTDPGVELVSFFGDQFPAGDMSRQIAREYSIPIFTSIDEALCLGTKELAVDAVLVIGEHGNYPHNELGQHMYPRKRFFDEVVAVMKRANRFVPMFNDKHLSYRWDWAKEMYDTAQELGIPLMAGSSVPLAQRRPPFELPANAEITEAVSIHGGGPESYGFHGLEVLQSIVEARKGGETGVASVEMLSGDALFDAAQKGLWSTALAEQAMQAEFGQPASLMEYVKGENPGPPAGILVRYNDGLKATVLQLGNSATRWNFACQLKAETAPRATAFYVGPWNNRNLFKALSHAIQTHFRNGMVPYPVERTLLTTGILDAAMHSRHQAGLRLPTPQLGIEYQPRDYVAMREYGRSWEVITEQMPEPAGITPHGI